MFALNILSTLVLSTHPFSLGAAPTPCSCALRRVFFAAPPASRPRRVVPSAAMREEDPTLHFDMGVQVLKPRGRFAEELEGVVKPWPRVGRFKRIRCTGDWRRWSIQAPWMAGISLAKKL